MNVARSPGELNRVPRAVALGTFDGVHRGHRRVIEVALAAGARATVVTFHPHPRTALGNFVELLSTLERRLELIAQLGVPETLVVEFDLDLARLTPEDFAARVLGEIGTEIVVAGTNFRFGRGRSGDLETLSQLGYETRPVPVVEGVSSTFVRQLVRGGELARAAQLLARPVEVEGIVVAGNQRGGTLGYPTANLAVDPNLIVPPYGIYAGAVGDVRAAVSIGTNPHYGGDERRIEAFLLDFDRDLYGRRLVLELWTRLRDEAVFESEEALIDQIGRDVAETRVALRPS
jgi:riboflavin kinase/FMN adenylyltransferase